MRLGIEVGVVAVAGAADILDVDHKLAFFLGKDQQIRCLELDLIPIAHTIEHKIEQF